MVEGGNSKDASLCQTLRAASMKECIPPKLCMSSGGASRVDNYRLTIHFGE
jgi:hypothetical protein